MSSCARVIVFYGIVFKRGGKDHKRFINPEESENCPYDMQFSGPVNGVQVITLGCDSYPAFALAVAETVCEGRGWESLCLDDVNTGFRTSAWDDPIIAYCKTHKLRYSKPRWYAVPDYS